MGNAIDTDYTFLQMVDNCVRIRKSGDEAVAKRSDARDFLDGQQLGGIEIPEEQILHISLGYLERLLRKLAAEFSELKLSSVALERYAEGCGVFTGTVNFTGSDGSQKRVVFHWEGRGEIESTWNSFSKWELS